MVKNPLRVWGNSSCCPKVCCVIHLCCPLPTNMNYGKIDTASLKCERSCIICPNVQNFCPNNGQFSSVGDATASPCRTLMPAGTKYNQHWWPYRMSELCCVCRTSSIVTTPAWASEGFFQGGRPVGDFPKIFPGGSKCIK